MFHREWLGLAQPIEGLVFSVPALDEAPVPAQRTELTSALRALLSPAHDASAPASEGNLAIRSADELFRRFLGYDAPGMLVPRASLPAELTFYAPESRQEIRPSFAIARGPFEADPDDPFALFDAPSGREGGGPSPPPTPPSSLVEDASSSLLQGSLRDPAAGRPEEGTTAHGDYIALVWDLGDDCPSPTALDLDAPEDLTGSWRYPPTAKLERLLRHTNIPVGLLTNRRQLRVVYAPTGEATSHLTFRFDDMADPAGRPLVVALDLLFHARRTYRADPKHTFEGLLAESRRRQADVTEKLAEQVFEAVERLLEGFESAASRDIGAERPDWLRAAMESGQVYEGVLNVILRIVFLLYAEDRSLLPVAHPTYAAHLSVLGLYERLMSDAGAHPESMHQRYGAYGALVSLFRAVYFGVRHTHAEHGDLHLPPRQGRLFDPSAYPFLEGGMPGWTAAVSLPEDRAAVRLPTIDDGTLHEVLHRLIVLDGQRISYRDLSVEQIGAVYESLMGFTVERMEGPAVRLGKLGYWVDVLRLRDASKTERQKLLEDKCDLSKAGIKNVTAILEQGAQPSLDALAEALVDAVSTKSDRHRHRARTGQLVLQPTASRRSTGSHYTPRSLSEKVVRRTLEPILACLGQAPRAEQILSLKVCDPAMGSGAFLVEACRFLGDAVVEAWRRSGELPALIEKEGNALLHAKRLVAQRCLYGVDKNAAAVELAKLSLWLETLSGEKPFTFLDHVLRHGDSLVGLDLEQVRAFHWTPGKQLPTVATLVDRALAEVREHRDAIQALADDESDLAQRDKRRLFELANGAMERVKLVADVCVGAFFAEDKKKAREEEREKRLAVVEAYLAGDDSLKPTLDDWALTIRRQHAPFHWHLELPEVFFLERPDPLEAGRTNGAAFMDAFVGNPPFMGMTHVAPQFGESYRNWLFELHSGTIGQSDLSAQFFRRSGSLLGAHGTIGLITTNTISQGDTRVTGLQHLLTQAEFEIFDATRSMMWPGDAAVSVSIVHLAKGAPRARATEQRRLDGRVVPAINSRLGQAAEHASPSPLVANVGASFQGHVVVGLGFVLTPQERDSLVERDPRAAEYVRPYIGGQEVNTSPTQAPDRFVICFRQESLEEAERRPELLQILRERVKPERDQVRRDAHRERWWRFGDYRQGLQDAIARLDRCMVTGIVSKHLMFSFQPTDRIFSHKLYAFPLTAYTAFAVLQSRLHEPWTRLLSSTLEDRLNYSASDCFETFPFPQPDPRTVIPALEDIGQRLYDTRAAYMIETQQGLTQTYNKLKDPACHDAPIVELRRLHEEMDRAVLDAYGWTDIVVPPFCPSTPAEQKALETFQDQVIDRLFVLNAQRAEEEKRAGIGKGTKEKAAKEKPRGAKKAKGRGGEGGQGELFGGDEKP
ncbi:MAG: type IIL restriction-modification enzyme MmeI [Sandaracinus sp.]